MVTITQTDLARRLKVSQRAVAYALSDDPRALKQLRPETRSRIVAAARRLNYRPNRLVHSLRTGRTQMVAFLMPSISYSFFPQLAMGVEAEAKRQGYHVLLSHVPAADDEVAEIEALLERRVDGLVIMPRFGREQRDKYRQLLREGFPLVFVGDAYEDVPASAVVVDDFDGMYRATEHLIRLGHQRIAHLAGSCGPSNMQLRLAGYRAAMQAHGLPVPDDYVQGFIPRDADTSQASMQRLLALPQRPTAVTAVTDHAALAGIEVAWAAGLRVPQDVAFVGFSDDIADVRFLKVPLTTVRVDTEEMGRRALRLLLEELRAPRRKKILEKLPVELVVRESCGAKRS